MMKGLRKCVAPLMISVMLIVVFFFMDSQSSFSWTVGQLSKSIKSSEKGQLVCDGNLFDYKEDHPCLVQQIRGWVNGKILPAEGHKFDHNPPRLDGQFGQPSIVDNILAQMEGGFYIECGAHNGELFSNSLFFELHRNWTGLLIEPNVEVFTQLLQKNRNAYHINACLSGSHQLQMAKFEMNAKSSVLSKILNVSDAKGIKNEDKRGTNVICVPLYSLLLSIGNPTVDFFSFDVEGAEIGILESIPWENVKIRVMLIEVTKVDRKRVIHRIMTGAGYCLVDQLKIDVVYAHSQYTTLCNVG